MRLSTKVGIIVAAVCVVFLAVRHGGVAMQAARPADMPEGAHFIQSGYDVNTNEPKGNWVACKVDDGQGANWCRVTDARGMVVYEGFYLPVNSSVPAQQSELKIAVNSVSKLWVRGPAEEAPVPVIRLENGKLLVPLADRDALSQRWREDSSEYNAVTEPDSD
jgi:hypothetical protein